MWEGSDTGTEQMFGLEFQKTVRANGYIAKSD